MSSDAVPDASPDAAPDEATSMMPTLTMPSIPGVSLLTKAYNKVQYVIAAKLSDPAADEYAQQQAEQAAQDAQVRQNQANEDASIAATDAAAAASQAEAVDLVARSKFKPKQLANQVAKGVLSGVGSLLLACFLFYGGHIAANAAIGYNTPFRILSFIYGVIFSIWVVPKALYDVYWKGKTLPYFTFFPISTYVPSGSLEKIFIGGFCYNEDDVSRAARAAVAALYTDAYKKSLANMATMAGAAGTAAAAAIKAIDSAKKPVESPIPPKPVGPPPKPEGPPPKPVEPPVPPKPEGPKPVEPPVPPKPEGPKPVETHVPPKPTGPKPVKPTPPI